MRSCTATSLQLHPKFGNAFLKISPKDKLEKFCLCDLNLCELLLVAEETIIAATHFQNNVCISSMSYRLSDYLYQYCKKIDVKHI